MILLACHLRSRYQTSVSGCSGHPATTQCDVSFALMRFLYLRSTRSLKKPGCVRTLVSKGNVRASRCVGMSLQTSMCAAPKVSVTYSHMFLLATAMSRSLATSEKKPGLWSPCSRAGS